MNTGAYLPRWPGLVMLWIGLAISRSTGMPQTGYITAVSNESASARDARHQQIAQRRAGPMVIVHRGAGDMAPENSLEAYAMAMDYGADGCEIDLRRTRDGVLVLFHDDMLDRLLKGVGEIGALTYVELMSLRPRLLRHRVLSCQGPPTFAALLELARQRAMLLHLDLKEPGLEEDIIALLDQADVWDHVVSVNDYNADRIRRHPKLRMLPYKTGLYEDRRDLDQSAVRASLPAPGQMIIVDDPRVAAYVLRRPAFQPVPLPSNLCVAPASGPERRRPEEPSLQFNLHAYWQSLGAPNRNRALEVLAADFPEAKRLSGNESDERRRMQHITERAWAAQALGVGSKSAEAVTLLERTVRERSLHQEWRYHGLDGVMAVRALAELKAVESVPLLVQMYRRVDPELKQISASWWTNYPLAWRDSRFKAELLPALGNLRCPASKRFLMAYVSSDETRVREWSPPEFAEATKALLRQDLTREELEMLLRHRHPAVRGTVLLACVDESTRLRSRLLRKVSPWGLELPRARPCRIASSKGIVP